MIICIKVPGDDWNFHLFLLCHNKYNDTNPRWCDPWSKPERWHNRDCARLWWRGAFWFVHHRLQASRATNVDANNWYIRLIRRIPSHVTFETLSKGSIGATTTWTTRLQLRCGLESEGDSKSRILVSTNFTHHVQSFNSSTHPPFITTKKCLSASESKLLSWSFNDMSRSGFVGH